MALGTDRSLRLPIDLERVAVDALPGPSLPAAHGTSHVDLAAALGRGHNAIVHRDYGRVGETVRVFMYADRVEVRSPGGLIPGITIDDLVQMRVTSIPRNPTLAGFLRDVPGYMERIGSGIRFIISETRARGLPDPEFIEHQDFTVTFRNGAPSTATADLNERQQIGLQIVRERGSISTGEYCAATGAAERTGFRDLQDLVAKGLLVARGKKRGQRYFLP